MLRDEPMDGYRETPTYIYMLKKCILTHIRMHKSVENKFMYLFIALRPMRSGFEFYRPIIVIDGTHLNGPTTKKFFVLQLIWVK